MGEPMNKYRNKPREIDGYRFASQAEADYYNQLKLLKRAGQVKEFTLQPRYTLFDAYIHRFTGKRIQKIEYVADFLVTYPDGRQEIIDVKGIQTPVYKLKKKWFEGKYPDLQIKEIS